MNSGTSVKFDASHHAVVVLLGLGAILVLVLPLARMPLLKLHCQRATNVLSSCVCYLAHLGPIFTANASRLQFSLKNGWGRAQNKMDIHQCTN